MDATPEQSSTHKIAGQTSILAERYAVALYELAKERNQIDPITEEMRAFLPFVKSDAAFRQLVRNPRLTRVQLAEAVKLVAKTAGLSELATSFLLLAAHRRRLLILGAMIDAFLALVAERRGEHTVEIRVVHPLTDDQKQKLAGEIAKQTGGKATLEIREDKSLLGGIVIKVGSYLIDASLSGKLARLERQLKLEQEAA